MGRLDYLREKMAEKGAGAMLVSSPIAEEYLSDFGYADGFLAILADKAYLVTDFRYIEAAEAALKGTDFEAVMAENGSLLQIASLHRSICGATIRYSTKTVWLRTLTRSRM